MKRSNYINRDEYFMGIAIISSHRSKDPVTQVGACIVDENKNIVGIGYNGLPKWCHDNEFPWTKNPDNMLEDKRTFVIHAEVNAILNSNSKLAWCTLYVLLFPCNECAKMIIQSGITTIIYLSDEDVHKYHNKAAKKMLDAAGVRYVVFSSDLKELVIPYRLHID